MDCSKRYMKNLFSGLFGSRKKNSSTDDMSLVDMMSFLETKIFPCSECGHFFQLDNPSPLTIAPCSQCGAGNFVPKKLGPFWLYKFCAEGGQGRVYKATCSLVPDTEFAVKILPEEVREDSVRIDSLRREAEITALFNDHPNSVNVVEFDRDDGIVYMATEYIDGLLLDKCIEKKGKLSEEDAVSYSISLLDIVEEIYSKGYLFRDLKPQNIIIGKDNNLVLMDYGICYPVGVGVDRVEDEVDGSPHFIPPERLTGEGEELCSEIYSIGMLMFYMLTGKTYFNGDSLQEIAELHVNGDRRANLASELPYIDEELVKLIDKMVLRIKRKRIQTIKEVRAVLNYLQKKHLAARQKLEEEYSN